MSIIDAITNQPFTEMPDDLDERLEYKHIKEAYMNSNSDVQREWVIQTGARGMDMWNKSLWRQVLKDKLAVYLTLGSITVEEHAQLTRLMMSEDGDAIQVVEAILETRK